MKIKYFYYFYEVLIIGDMSVLDSQPGKSVSRLRLNNTDELSLHHNTRNVVLCT